MTLRGKAALEAALKGRKRTNKYNVSPPAERTVGGILFASKAEARRYTELLLLVRSGDARFFLRQVAFDLPGKTKYLLDFLVFWTDGHQSFEDVKGVKTAVYRLKKRQVEELYTGVVIDEL